MFISVDFPDPDGPTMTTNSPVVTDEVDAVERPHRRRAGVVLGDAAQLEDWSTVVRPLEDVLAHGTTTWSPASTSPVTATRSSANTPRSTPTKCVAPPPSDTSTA